MPSIRVDQEEVDQSRTLKAESEAREKEEGFPFKAIGGWVLIQPAQGDRLGSGLLAGYRSEYPQGGWVISSAARQEEIKEGDYVILEVDAWDIASTYYEVFEILVNDEGTILSILCDPEIEPIVKEQFELYHQTSEDNWITLSDLTGEGWRFLTSDILTTQRAEGNSPGFSLLYPKEIYMFRFRGGLIYKVHETSILAILKEW